MLIDFKLGLTVILATSTVALAALPYQPRHRIRKSNLANRFDRRFFPRNVVYSSSFSSSTTSSAQLGPPTPPPGGAGSSGGTNDDDCDGSDGGETGAQPPDGSDGQSTVPICQNEIVATPKDLATGSLTGDDGCSLFVTVKAGDTCDSIINSTGSELGLTGFLQANPVIDPTTCNNLQPGMVLCADGPKLIQFGSETLDTGCKRFHCVVKGDFCIKVAEELGDVTSDELIALNPEFGPDCFNMWFGSWICSLGDTSSSPGNNYGGISASMSSSSPGNNYGGMDASMPGSVPALPTPDPTPSSDSVPNVYGTKY